jgi:hypothetical protein
MPWLTWLCSLCKIDSSGRKSDVAVVRTVVSVQPAALVVSGGSPLLPSLSALSASNLITPYGRVVLFQFRNY